MLRFLEPSGSLVHTNGSAQKTLDILMSLGLAAPDILAIYRLMLQVRLFHEKADVESKLDRMTLYIGPKGHEAIQAAGPYALDPRDLLLFYARSHPVAFARGVTPHTLFSYFYSYANPPSDCAKKLFERRIGMPYTSVGIHIPHAVGAAWAATLRGERMIAVAFFGDGATSEGDFHSALNWASTLRIPVILICENNRYAISTPLELQMGKPDRLCARASLYGAVASRIDGNDPFAVWTAVKRAREQALKNSTPVFIEALTYREGPHTNAVGEIVPIPENMLRAMREENAIERMRRFLLSKGAYQHFGIRWSEDNDRALSEELRSDIATAAEATHEEYKQTLLVTPSVVGYNETLNTLPCVGAHYQCPTFTPSGSTTIPHATGRDAVGVALFDLMSYDPHVVCVGEDIGAAGGVMRTTALREELASELLPGFDARIIQKFMPLQQRFPDQIFDSPLDESGIIGTAVGMAMNGLRPIVEIQFSGFAGFAFHHIDEAARIMQRSAGFYKIPLVVRLPFGCGGRIEYHNTCEIGRFLGIPGLVICCPSTVQDFYDLLWAAVASDKPVLVFEHLELYRGVIRDTLTRRACIAEIEHIGARRAREGDDITLVSYGYLVHQCLAAADVLAKERGVSADVLDLRVLQPLDEESIRESIRATGRLVVVHEEPGAHSIAARVAAIASQRADRGSLYYLRAPIGIVGSRWAHPPQPKLWKEHFPGVEHIVAEALAVIADST